MHILEYERSMEKMNTIDLKYEEIRGYYELNFKLDIVKKKKIHTSAYVSPSY